MVNGAIFFTPRPFDLGLQRRDPSIQFGDGHGVEILPRQRGQRVGRRAGENLVQVHGEES